MSKHALAGIIGQRERIVIGSVVDSVRATQTNEAMKLMPVKNTPAAFLVTTKISSFGGQTGERAFDAPGKSIPSRSHTGRYYAPGAYQESIIWGERELLMYAKAGTLSERGITGLTSDQLDEMTMAGEKLRGRIDNRMANLIWSAMFTGKFTYQGITTDFQVPTQNFYQSGSDWTNFATSTPFSDLLNLITFTANIRKYKIKEFLLGPKSWAELMLSQQTQTALRNWNLTSADPNKVAELLFPGLPPIRQIKDAYQEESYASDGSIILGDANYMVPDDRVLIVPDFGSLLYKEYGEFQVTENMNDPSATTATPAKGIYLFVDEKGLEQRKNPFVEIVAGFNGGPNLMRGDDLLIMKTRPGS